jgi:hypothetical protein
MKHVFIFLKKGIVKNHAKTSFTHKSQAKGRILPILLGSAEPGNFV